MLMASTSENRNSKNTHAQVAKRAWSLILGEIHAPSSKKELNELETMETSAVACKEVFLSTEGKSDALLPVTPGPENPTWHRWFQRVRSSHSRKWWTSRGSSDIS